MNLDEKCFVPSVMIASDTLSPKCKYIIIEAENYKKLQEQNKIMRDALEFISTLDNKELVGQEVKDLPKTISGITAREALAKVGVLSDKEVFDLAGKIYGLIKIPDLPIEGVPFGEPIKDGE